MVHNGNFSHFLDFFMSAEAFDSRKAELVGVSRYRTHKTQNTRNIGNGWVPVKSRRLQDWEKPQKYVPANNVVTFYPKGFQQLKAIVTIQNEESPHVQCVFRGPHAHFAFGGRRGHGPPTPTFGSFATVSMQILKKHTHYPPCPPPTD